MGLPFCFARFTSVVLNDRVDSESAIFRRLLGALGAIEKDRKDWRRGVRSRDVVVCVDAICAGCRGRGRANECH